MSTFKCEQPFSWDRWFEQLQQCDIHFFRWPMVVRYMMCSWASSFCIRLYRSMIDVDARSCLLHVVMIPCLIWCKIFLCDVLSVITLYVMLWDPLLYVVGILLMLKCMCFSLTSLLCHVGGMRTMLVLCHTDRSLLIESSSCGTSLRATPAWGHSSLYDRDIISMYIMFIDNT